MKTLRFSGVHLFVSVVVLVIVPCVRLFGQASAITSFTPTSGPVGTIVTVEMTQNPRSVTLVLSASVNGLSATVLNYGRPADGRITLQLTVPQGATTGPIRVVTFNSVLQADETATSAMPFTVTTGVTAAIRGFSPTSGPVGTVVTVTGIGFTGVTSVNFQGQRIPVSVAADGMSATFTVPSGASGMAAFSLNLPNGQIAVAPMPFTVTTGVTAAIRGFSPTSGPVGTVVTVTGIGFTGVTSANFQGQRIPVSVAADGMSATFTVPSGASGMAAFSLNLPNGQFAIAPMPFTVTAPAAPATITGISPTSGSPGTLITITGTNFTGTLLVAIGGRVSAFTVVSPTTITATIPTGIPAGPTPIIVRTPAGDVTSTITLLVTLSVRVAEEYSMKVSPQPTADAATLEYTLSAPSVVETSIVNTLGTTMLTLPKTQQSSGIQRTQLNVQSLPVGMYFVRVNIGGNIATLPLQVVR